MGRKRTTEASTTSRRVVQAVPSSQASSGLNGLNGMACGSSNTLGALLSGLPQEPNDEDHEEWVERLFGCEPQQPPPSCSSTGSFADAGQPAWMQQMQQQQGAAPRGGAAVNGARPRGRSRQPKPASETTQHGAVCSGEPPSSRPAHFDSGGPPMVSKMMNTAPSLDGFSHQPTEPSWPGGPAPP